MDSITIWHNPRCAKSRAGLALLRERGIEPHVVHYLEDTPSEEAIDAVLRASDMEPRELMRKSEAIYKELRLEDAHLTRAQLVAAMAQHPKLIERPVVIRGARAALGRPVENLLPLLEA